MNLPYVNPTFKGTIFENIKERGATIGGKFGKMVCDKAEVDLYNFLAEYHISTGILDGVEIDDAGNIISIYECGSGIHLGKKLDWDHFNKIFGKYVFSKEIWTNHLKRIIILAGDYDEDMLTAINNAKSLFSMRNIEIVILKTFKINNKITVERII